MGTKIVFEYDQISKEFLRERVAFESPREEGIFHYPSNCTELEPPALQEGKALVYDEALNIWNLIDDNRGLWYSADRLEHNVLSLSDVIPAGWTRTIPSKTIAELKVEKHIQINQWRAAANTSTFNHSSKTFACDALSRSDIDAVNGRIATRDSFPAGWAGGWKAVDNTILEITTVTQWNDFYDAMVNQGTTNFVHSQELKLALANATTKAQVAAIVW